MINYILKILPLLLPLAVLGQVRIGLEEVDPGSLPHQLSMEYTFDADYNSGSNDDWNSQLVTLRYAETAPAASTFFASLTSNSCFNWTFIEVGICSGDRYVILQDSDGALNCPFDLNDVVDMLTISFDPAGAPSTLDFELVASGDPCLVTFGFGDPAVNNAGTGQNEFSSYSPCCVSNLALPLELIYFNVSDLNNSIRLDWTSTREVNFSGYELQRSTDGISFKKIAWINGNGNIDSANNYDFTDIQLEVGVRYYYRLKMLDLDGSFAYSPVRSATLNTSFITPSILPNPTNGHCDIYFNSTAEGSSKLTISDMIGRTVLEKDIPVVKGENTVEINMAPLSDGIYILQLINSNKPYWTERIIKF
ncbi:MAG: T9SS type A sorting domain-containing protein [Bacteroidota bacterium]